MLPSVRMLLGAAVVVAVASPALRPAKDDSYPLSTYPMFARTLERPRLTVAEGLTDSGSALRLPPELVANAEPMQAMRTLSLTAREGKAALRRLCARIAERTARSPAFHEVRRVRIVSTRYDPLSYFEREPQGEEPRTLAHCPVRREP